MTTSEQARADALADAETLRLNLHSGDIAIASVEGDLAAVYPEAESGFAARCAKRAARAAFRAVPGLRG